MRTRIVCDASAVIAALLDSGDDGQWATAQIAGGDLYAPTLLPFECGASIITRIVTAGLRDGTKPTNDTLFSVAE